MVFSSIIFLFFFLPAVLAVYHLVFLPVTLGWHPQFFRRASNFFLLLVSLLFYFWGENFLIWIVLASTIIDYFAGLIISGGYRRGEIAELDEKRQPSAVQRFGLVLSLVSNLAFLGYFKYINFAVENAQSGLLALGIDTPGWLSVPGVVLPLGISFYTFQSMSYTIDVYLGKVRATRNLVDFACYVTMFPQLVAGPIVRYRDVATQLVSRRVTSSKFASGVVRFALGLGKKVLIANTVATAADGIFALPASELTLGLTWLGILAYALQIYFDFSGYSDMAIGLGRMFGFEYLENFNYPYIAQSIQDFWHRWHISLSTWFRDYLYIPIGGSRGSNPRTFANLVTVFFLCGLWHGAAWNFVVWGLFHGFFLVFERIGLASALKQLPRPLRHGYTLIVVLVGWVFFRSETLPYSLSFLAAMFGFGSATGFEHTTAEFLRPDVALAVVIGIIGSAPIMPAIKTKLDQTWNRLAAMGHYQAIRFFLIPAEVLFIAAVLVMSAMSLASGTYNPFIYFRF